MPGDPEFELPPFCDGSSPTPSGDDDERQLPSMPIDFSVGYKDCRSSCNVGK